jgi:hypothetical protein
MLFPKMLENEWPLHLESKPAVELVNISETEKEKRIHSRRAKTSNAPSVSKRTYHNCFVQAEHATGESKAR